MTFNFEKVRFADAKVMIPVLKILNNLSLNRRNSAPLVLDYDGRVV